jgi:hypothetical protein
MAYLYRGVNRRLDDELGGVLKPHGTAPAVAILADGSFYADGTATYGETTENAARAHQIRAGLYGGSFVSFTRSREVALDFATKGFAEPGFIYTIDASNLEAHGVTAHSFRDPRHPNEDEVSLSHAAGGPIPAVLIVSKQLVDRDGLPITG